MGKKASIKSYCVDYERDAEGYWTAVIDHKQGVSCITQGRSLSQARTRIREALALYLDDDKAAAAAELVDNVKLRGPALAAVRSTAAARSAMAAAEEKAHRESAKAAKLLTADGLSRRDTAELLGVSFQRIQQLAGSGKAAGRVRSK